MSRERGGAPPAQTQGATARNRAFRPTPDALTVLAEAGQPVVVMLASTDFDSRAILSVVLSGDKRLLKKLRTADLKPLASRIRQRLVMAPDEPPDLAHLLDHLLAQAANPALMTDGLKDTLCAHAGANPTSTTQVVFRLISLDIGGMRTCKHLFLLISDSPNGL